MWRGQARVAAARSAVVADAAQERDAVNPAKNSHGSRMRQDGRWPPDCMAMSSMGAIAHAIAAKARSPPRSVSRGRTYCGPEGSERERGEIEHDERERRLPERQRPEHGENGGELIGRADEAIMMSRHP